MSKPDLGVALVTGASTGIGRATAKALQNAGFRVFGTSRRAVSENPEGITMLICDVTDDASVAALVDEVLAKAGRIDLLVNNAGIGLLGGAEESSIAQAQVYNAVKNEVVKQAPEYARTMADYEKASNLIREIEKTLSLNPKASIDTTLRKLQSVMRDNVNTNYGKRADLVQLLQDSGAKNLLNKLAGQSLKSFEPRGLARVTAGLGTIATGAGAAFLNPMSLLPVAGALATQSPRLVGELTHLGGRGANALSRVPVRNALMAGYQTRGASNAFMGY